MRLTVTSEQMDWMRHSVLLGRERLKKPMLMGTDAVARLRWMVQTQEAVIVAIERKLVLTGALVAVAAELMRYADLQIARRKRLIDEATFYTQSTESRARLAAELVREVA